MKKLVLVLGLIVLVGCASYPAVPEELPEGCRMWVAGSELVYKRAGFTHIYHSFEGKRTFEDDFGIDWTVIERCNAVALHTKQGGEDVSYIFFAPEGFPLEEVYEEPWMGARNLVVLSEPGRRLIIQAGGEQIGF